MTFLTRPLSALILTAAVFSSVSAFAALPSQYQGDSVIKQQFNAFPNNHNNNND